jgi:hypothetical protein
MSKAKIKIVYFTVVYLSYVTNLSKKIGVLQ